MGGIGRNLKIKAEALGMRVQYYNRKELVPELAGGANYVGFEELLGTSDVISLNLPFNVSLGSTTAFKCFYIQIIVQSSFDQSAHDTVKS